MPNLSTLLQRIPKTAIAVGVPVALAVGGMGLYTTQIARQGLTDSVIDLIASRSSDAAHELDTSFRALESVPLANARLMESLGTTDRNLPPKLLKGVISNHPDIFGACVAYESGALIPGVHAYMPYVYQRTAGDTSGYSLDWVKDYLDPAKQKEGGAHSWYREAMERPGQVTWTLPYNYPVTLPDGQQISVLMTTVETTITRNGRPVGVSTSDVTLDRLIKFASQVKLGEKGYAVLLDHKGHVLSHPDPALRFSEKTSLDDVLLKNARYGELSAWHDRIVSPEQRAGKDVVRASDAGMVFRFKDEAGAHLAALATIPSTGWSLLIVGDEGELFAATHRMQLINLLLTLLMGLGIFGFIWWQVNSVTAPIRHMAAMLRQIVQGKSDLSYRLKTNRKDEVGDLIGLFNAFIEKFQGMLQLVEQSARGVQRGVSEINERTETLSRAAHTQIQVADETHAVVADVAASIQQVAGNAQTLATDVSDTSSSMQEMTASIQQVARNTEVMATVVEDTTQSVDRMVESIQHIGSNVASASRAATQTSEAARTGSHSVSQVVAGMDRITATMSELVAVMERLGKSSAEIGSIIGVIDDISEQTNLLALNAAIEAARAGEAGRGFAVVADEVRKLAERSNRATAEIAGLIKGIQSETRQAVVSTQEGDAAIHAGTALAREAGSALEGIVASIQEVTRLMEQTTRATEDQARASEQMGQAIARMRAIADEVSLSTQEQARGSEQVMTAIGSMNRLTQQVSLATSDQHRNSERVVGTVTNITRSAQAAAEATTMISRTTEGLTDQARQLMAVLAAFKGETPELEPSRERTLTLTLPSAGR